VVPPQMRKGQEWFQGTADAVFQNLNLIQHHDPKLVIVFGADHVYRMDVRQMIAFHQERQADITVAALPVPLDQASAFGIIATDADGRVREFQEKPEHPSPMPSKPDRAYASMGNYLFSTRVLMEALKEIPQRGENDFAKHILPRLIDSHRLYAYDFGTNRVSGVRRYEEKGYWRDVGTLEAYFSAHQDVLSLTPRFELFNPRWPIYSSNYPGPVSKFDGARLENRIVAAGCLLKKGVSVRNSVIRREVILEEGVELEDCIIMDYAVIKRGSRLRKTIVDRYNIIKTDTRIGYDLEADRQIFHVSPSGIVVVPQSETRKIGHAYFED
jgi:glucose-1-phosphate adenylyltransferase